MTKPTAPPCAICLGDPCRDPRRHAAILARIADGLEDCAGEKHWRTGIVRAAYWSATAGPLCRECWIERFGQKSKKG